jgi:cytochrome c oxidase subunit 1
MRAEGIVAGAHNQPGAMHGTIMVFPGVVPSQSVAGNFVMPLQIGARQSVLAQQMSYWYFIGGVIMLVSFFPAGGAAQSGGRRIRRWRSSRPARPLAIGMIFLITSSPRLHQFHRHDRPTACQGPQLMCPPFVWAQFVTSFLLLPRSTLEVVVSCSSGIAWPARASSCRPRGTGKPL